MRHSRVSSGSISICDICFNLAFKQPKGEYFCSKHLGICACLSPPHLPPFCLRKVLIFAQIQEALAAEKKEKTFLVFQEGFLGNVFWLYTV